MKKSVCPLHEKEMSYLCLAPECEWTGPVCAHRDCVKRHRHRLELELVHIRLLLKDLRERRESSRETILRVRGLMEQYYSQLEAELASAFDQEENSCKVCEKVFMNLESITPAIEESMSMVSKGQLASIDKATLVEMFKVLSCKKAAEQAEEQRLSLENEIQRKRGQTKKMIGKLLESYLYTQLFSVSVFDASKQVRVRRFTGQTSSWSFSEGKIDAVQITVTQPMRLVGFTHFGLTDWSGRAEIKLCVRIYAASKEVMKENFTFKQEVCLDRDFDVNFEQPVQLVEDTEYDIASENVGGQFHARYGSSADSSSTEVTFNKSSFDTNGTSNSSGQFHSLIFNSKL